MHKTITLTILIGFTISCSVSKKTTSKQADQKPNIIYILADDLGYGDLSCYGQTQFETPNIDKLAASGMRFTQHYSGSTVCAPSRSALMTGLHTGHTPIRGNRELKPKEGQLPIPGHFETLPEVLKKAGYATGAFGKWGLGYSGSEGDPTNQGFDEFYGYNCQRMAHRYYPPYLWDNQEKDSLAGNDWTNTVTYAPDKIHERAMNFIKKNKDQPFFAYIPLVQPHAELIAPNDSIMAKFLGKYEEPKVKPTKSTGNYGPGIEISKYAFQENPKAVYAAMIYRIDVYIGQIMAQLETLRIAENTIIIFTSDNGPHYEGGHDPEANFNSNGQYRGHKRDMYEGGIRVPLIVNWQGKIQPGSESDHISAFWDMLPTFADIIGAPIPPETDGISMKNELLGQSQKQHEYLYWEINLRGGRQGIRQGKWKGVLYNIQKGNTQIELYDLETDPSESKDLAAQFPEKASELTLLLKEARVDSELFPLKKIRNKK